MPLPARALTPVSLILYLVLAGLLGWVFWDQVEALWLDAVHQQPTVCVIEEDGKQRLITCPPDAAPAG